MATGTVKWFNDSKGYGFIAPSEGGADLFVHSSALRDSGLFSLTEGQAVSFEVEEGRKGLQATRIQLAG
ncbi:MAG: cold-shock protein [Chromatiales bacterium]|nr:cold-shock protein [Chromatiales bacterium]